MTSEQIKKNPERYYYPVLLIYYKEIIYNDKKTVILNNYTSYHSNQLEEECLKAKNSHIPLTDEQKKQNLIELEMAQRRIERNRRYSMNEKYNSFGMNIEEEDDIKENNIIFPEFNSNKNKLLKSEEKNKENNNMILEEKTQKENTEKKRTNKRYGTLNTNHKNYHFQKFANFDFFQDIL